MAYSTTKFLVTLTIEGEGPPGDDIVVKKEVVAPDSKTAVSMAIDLVKKENPELNPRKAWEWSVRQVF